MDRGSCYPARLLKAMRFIWDILPLPERRISIHFTVCQRRGKTCASQEGTANAAGNVFGTYIHGVFDNDVFRRSVLNALRHSKGLEALANTRNVMAEKQKAYEHLADVVENALDMEKLYQIMGEKTC